MQSGSLFTNIIGSLSTQIANYVCDNNFQNIDRVTLKNSRVFDLRPGAIYISLKDQREDIENILMQSTICAKRTK